MIRQEDVYQIGVLGKAHGVKGELSMHFTDDVFDRVEADCLILEVDGILVPFFIEDYRFRNDQTVLMKLEGVDTQERARQLTNSRVFFLRKLAEADEDAPMTWQMTVGFTVTEASTGRVAGIIKAVDETTLNLLLELDNGLLIPVSDELVEDFNPDGRNITIKMPEGLLDL